MKDDTKRFFSPYATWTRIPGASDSSEGNEVSMDSVGDAVDEYVRVYSKLIDSAAPGSEGAHAIAGAGGDAEGYINEEYLEFYLSYRTLKDPARRLLTG
jgi:Ferredoxin-dependent bilin reductase